MRFEDILSLANRDLDRDSLLRLGKQYFEVTRTATTVAADPRRDAVLDQLMQAIDRHLVNVRFPLPSRHQVTAMVVDYFERHGD